MKYPRAKVAEENFREAFERLKRGAPVLLPSIAVVSQNNVAKEAGCVPSALRKSRFPRLVAEIKDYVSRQTEDQLPSKRQRILAQRKRSRSARQTITDLRSQRDFVASLMVEANSRISILTLKVRDLEARVEDLQAKPIVLSLPTAGSRSRPKLMDTPEKT